MVLNEGMGQKRQGPTAAHALCDAFIQEFRNQLKKFHGNECTERHEYHDVVRTGKKKVQSSNRWQVRGAMPILVTQNEYRDGIIRSMQ